MTHDSDTIKPDVEKSSGDSVLNGVDETHIYVINNILVMKIQKRTRAPMPPTTMVAGSAIAPPSRGTLSYE